MELLWNCSVVDFDQRGGHKNTIDNFNYFLNCLHQQFSPIFRIVWCRYRALRLDSGNYAWGSENCTKKVRILDVVYNATSNELVRTKTLLKNAIVQIDGQPFRQWYLKKYGVNLGFLGNRLWKPFSTRISKDQQD